jgi:hypothetical protein
MLKKNNPSSAWDGFNALWADALNETKNGFTHFAMLHADVLPLEGVPWVDVLIGEMDRLSADLVSTTIAIKDLRGLTSSGIGDPNDHWAPLKRFTVRETLDLPETFNAADAGFPGHALLHNQGCFVADLRSPVFHKTNPDGSLAVYFNFPRRVMRAGVDAPWIVQGESEDWFFSREFHECGGKGYLTRKVHIQHGGSLDYDNFTPWGTYMNGDENTAAKWKTVKVESSVAEPNQG